MTTLTRTLLATACTALALTIGEGQLQAQERLKIGLVAPLTGPFADRGRMIAAGASLYLKEQSASPLGRPIEIVTKDSFGSPEVARLHTQELVVNDKVDFLLGFVTAPEALAVAPVVENAKIPTIVLSNTDTLPQRSRYFVRSSYDRGSLLRVLATVARETDSRRFATLAKEHPVSLDFAGKFKAALQHPQEVTLALLAPVQNGDFDGYAGQIRRSNAQALLVVGIAPNELRQMRERFASQPGSNSALKIIATGELTESDGLAQLGDAALGLLSVWHYNEARSSSRNDAFRKAFKKDNRDHEPTSDAVAGYDGMHLIYEALKRTNCRLEGDRLIDAMRGLRWESPRGVVAITDGRDIDQTIYLRRVEKTGSGLANGILAQYRIDGSRTEGSSSGNISVGSGGCSSGNGGGPVAFPIPGQKGQPAERVLSDAVQTFVNGTTLMTAERDRVVQAAQGAMLAESGRRLLGVEVNRKIDPGVEPILALGVRRVRPVEIDSVRHYLDHIGIKPQTPRYSDAIANELLKRYPDLGRRPGGDFHPYQVRPGSGRNGFGEMTAPGFGESGTAPALSNSAAGAQTSETSAQGQAAGSAQGSAEGTTTTVAGTAISPREAIAIDKLIYPTPGPGCTPVEAAARPEDQAAFYSGAVSPEQKLFCRYGFTDVVFITFPASAGQDLCSGAFLTPTHVLTAAHCAKNAAVESIRVFAPQAGLHDCLTDKIRVAAGDMSKLTNLCQLPVAKVGKVTRTTTSGNSENLRALDLAVLELESVPRLDGKPIRPRLVELGPVKADDTMEVTMVGYGLTALQDASFGGVLQAGWSLLDRYVDRLLTSSPDESPVQIPMSGVGQRTLSCAGDSGAPIFAGRLFGWSNEVRRIVGVVSSGMKLGGCQPDDRVAGSMSPLLHPDALAFICAATDRQLPLCRAQ